MWQVKQAIAQGFVDYQQYVRVCGVTFVEQHDATINAPLNKLRGNVQLFVNEALSNGLLHLPHNRSQPLVKVHEDTVFICAANTWGSGPDREYVGRARLDTAFLDRFCHGKVFIDYDKNLERALSGDDELCNVYHTMRKNVRNAKIRRPVSTRAILQATNLRQNLKWSIKQCVHQFQIDWTKDEKEAGLKDILL